MDGLFKNKYKVDSSRLNEWDYSNDGHYFVTVCVKDRKNYFGQVKGNIIGLSEMGDIAGRCWYELPGHYKNCFLDEFIIMPNHIHAVIVINNESRRDGACPVSTPGQHRSLSNMIGSFKSACTKKIRESGYKSFSWQNGFYDHIIRIDSESLEKIRYYIKYNPTMWSRDRNNLDKK